MRTSGIRLAVLGGAFAFVHALGDSVYGKLLRGAIVLHAMNLALCVLMVGVSNRRWFPNARAHTRLKLDLLSSSISVHDVLIRQYSVLTLVALIGSFVVSARAWPLALWLFWMTALEIALRNQPPAVVFLGHSSDETLRLYRKLKRVIAPRKVANLLDALRFFGDLRGIPDVAAVFADTLRTTADDWQTIVREAVGMAHLVVVDVRSLSEPLRQEIDVLRNAGFFYKTLFVADEDTYEANLPPGATMAITPEQAIRLFQASLSTPDDMPTPARPLATWLRNMQKGQAQPSFSRAAG